MKENEKIYILMSEETADDYVSDFMDDYLNSNFGQYTLIMSEDNNSIIMNEEGDAYMIMEFNV